MPLIKSVIYFAVGQGGEVESIGAKGWDRRRGTVTREQNGFFSIRDILTRYCADSLCIQLVTV